MNSSDAIPETKGAGATGEPSANELRVAMGELLSAIEDEREPLNSARDNLDAIRLYQAALRSVRVGGPVAV